MEAKKEDIKQKKLIVKKTKDSSVIPVRRDSDDIINHLKQLEEGKYHIGGKVLYDQPPDTEWSCCCVKGDKDLCVFIFKCGVMSSVLGFCMVMLMNGNSDGFYVSTLSLILGGVMGGTDSSKQTEGKDKIV